MRKRLLIASCLAAALDAVLIYSQRSRAQSPKQRTITLPSLRPVVPEPVPEPVPGTAEPVPNAAAPAPALVSTRLDPTSELFIDKIDELIPSHLYSVAGKCYHGGLNEDQKLKLGFSLSIADSEISAHDIRVLKSTLTSATLERCIIAAVASAHWRDETLPDWESSDEELLIRLSGFKAYQHDSD
jgi:hypothetical protein